MERYLELGDSFAGVLPADSVGDRLAGGVSQKPGWASLIASTGGRMRRFGPTGAG
jgi:hypothetical protein